jgi:hypothetical protein
LFIPINSLFPSEQIGGIGVTVGVTAGVLDLTVGVLDVTVGFLIDRVLREVTNVDGGEVALFELGEVLEVLDESSGSTIVE